MLLSELVRGTFLSSSSSSHTMSVAIMAWIDEQLTFVIETYLKNVDSIIAMQLLFHKHFVVS